MDHIVCLDEGARELESLISGTKSMILRAHDEQILSLGQISVGDNLYFLEGPLQTEIRVRGVVSYVYISNRLTVEESYKTIIENQDKLQLPDNQFYDVAGKQYIVLVGVSDITRTDPVIVEKSDPAEPCDWKTISSIEMTAQVKL
jgi:hypothetical protein